MAIAISIGIREQSILASIFMLHFSTMCFGFLTEYISVPKALADRVPKNNPVGPEQFKLWEEKKPVGRVDYRHDPRALKLISRLVRQCKLEAMLFQLSILRSISRILDNPASKQPKFADLYATCAFISRRWM